MKNIYDELYYKSRYITPFYTKLHLHDCYYLWFAYFCLIQPVALSQKNKVLDVGCGVGNFVWALRKFNIQAYGIDPSYAAKPFCKVPKYCDYKDTGVLPYDNNKFDLVYTHEVLEHINLRLMETLLSEMWRVSKGTMIHVVGIKNLGKIVTEDPTHLIIEDEKWWERKFEQLGYSVKKGNFFYFFPNVYEVFSGNLNPFTIKKGYFLLKKSK